LLIMARKVDPFLEYLEEQLAPQIHREEMEIEDSLATKARARAKSVGKGEVHWQGQVQGKGKPIDECTEEGKSIGKGKSDKGKSVYGWRARQARAMARPTGKSKSPGKGKSQTIDLQGPSDAESSSETKDLEPPRKRR